MSTLDSPVPPPVQPAATILVVRPAPRPTEAGHEVFMVKRHRKSAFLPSAHVFPGGRLEPGDLALARRLAPEARAAALALLDGLEDPEQAAALCVAAIRETAEEAGLILARNAAGQRPGQDVARALFEALREGRAFEALLDAHRLTPDVSALHAFGWWVTPPFERRRRFNTRFFLAAAPPDQRATFDAIETTEGVWLAPADALARFAEGSLSLAPPTLASLEILAAADGPEAALAAVRRPIRPIMPCLADTPEGDRILALPGDPLFPGDAPPALPHRTRFRVVGKGHFVRGFRISDFGLGISDWDLAGHVP